MSDGGEQSSPQASARGSPEKSKRDSDDEEGEGEEESGEDEDFDFDDMMPAVDMTAYYKKDEIDLILQNAIKDSEDKLLAE